MPYCTTCGALVAAIPCPHCCGAGAAAVLLPESPSPLPAALRDRFNFGACFFGIVWTLYNADVNQRWIAVAALVGGGAATGFLVPIGYHLWLGFHANRLAAEHGRFANVETFRETQRSWTRWAIVAASAMVAIGLACAIALAAAAIAAAGRTV